MSDSRKKNHKKKSHKNKPIKKSRKKFSKHTKSSTKIKKKNISKKKKKKKKVSQNLGKGLSKNHRIKELLIKIVSAFFITLFAYVVIFTILFTVARMDGYSMISTLNNRDVVAVSRRKKIKRFDLVYMDTPQNKKNKAIRRIIGVPGDEIYFKNDDLIINGEIKEEKYLLKKKKMLGDMVLTDDFSLKEITGKQKIPAGMYFVLGDNRKSSTDSRYYGFVSKEDIVGKVELRLFPFSEFTIF